MKGNPNKGTARGRKAIRASLATYGAGRSILVDKHGEAIAGHHTADAADEVGLRRRVVQTDGKELVVVQREDLDADNPEDRRAAGLAIADNRAGELNRRWDAKQITADKGLLEDAGITMFAPVEMADFAAEVAKTPTAPTEQDADDDNTVRIAFDEPEQLTRWLAWVARCAAVYPETTTVEQRVLAAIAEPQP